MKQPEASLHRLPIDAAFARLHSSPNGLSSVEAARRLREFGPNRIERPRRRPLVVRMLGHFTHFLAVLLWVAALLAAIAGVQMPGQGMETLAAAIVAVILVNGAFSFWQQYRAEQTMAALQRLLPDRVRVYRDGVVAVVPATEIVPGDVIALSAGDRVPADCRLIEAFSVRVNLASLTGEALPVPRDAQAPPDDDLLRSRNVVLAGTTLVGGEAKALVLATGMATAFGHVARLAQQTRDTPSPLQTEIAALSRMIAVLALAIGAVVLVIGRASGLSTESAFVFSIGVIVANVPEGLLPTVTLAMAMAARRLARKRVLVRHLPAVETLGSATVICTDKTGTLTQNRMEVRSIYVAEGFVDPAALPAGFVSSHRWFVEAAASCHDLRAAGAGQGAPWVGDPTEQALVAWATGALGQPLSLPRVGEIPFDPERKRLVTIHRRGDEVVLFVKGALEEIASRARWVDVGGAREPLDAARTPAFTQAQDAMADRGLRVLAFAYRILPANYSLADAEQELVLTALVGLEDPPRPEVPAAIRRCREAGIKVLMITGDYAHTAVAIARAIGLVQSPAPRVMSGDDLRRMSDAELQRALDAPDVICARATADQKLRIVEALRRKQHVVAVTGDGVNDAPALRAADIGVAMGVAGTDVAREAADLVLLDDNFAGIVEAVEQGRAIVDNIRKFLTYILTSNVPELVPYLAYAFAGIPLGLTVVQILAVDLGTDLVPALGLGAEPPDAAVMRKPPRPRTERLLSAGLLLRAYGFLGVLEAAAAMAAFFFVLARAGWWPGAPYPPSDSVYRAATTACLTAIVVMQVVNVQLCRSRRRSLLALPWPGNRLIVAGIVVELVLILLIDYTAVGHAVFGTAPLSIDVWLFMLPFALAMAVLEELRKLAVRTWHAGRVRRISEQPRSAAAR